MAQEGGSAENGCSVNQGLYPGYALTIRKPAGSHGPVRRRPIAELVDEEEWAHAPDWAVDPPGTRHTAAGPPRPQTSAPSE